MGLLDFLRGNREARDDRGDQERAVTISTINTAALKAQADQLVRNIRTELDNLDDVLEQMETPSE